jgi:hypothetical protein
MSVMKWNRRGLLGAGVGLTGAGAVGAGVAGAAPNQPGAAFDPRAYQSQVHGQRTRVMVLASPHVSGAPDTFDPAVLEPLLQRLQAFAPDFIAIEALSGESVDMLWRHRAVYPGVANTYGAFIDIMAAAGRAGTGLDLAEAEAEARRTLSAWPSGPTPAQRRRLAAVFASAGDPYSALVQWWRLEPAERKPADGLGRTLADKLNQQDRSRNENDVIGVRLAVRLGHERIHSIDDHAADDLVIPQGEDLEAFVSQPWFQAVIEDPAFKRLSQASQALTTPQQALATYQMLNAPETGRIDADGQWLTFINRASVNDVGRRKVAEWEARNLRQAAHIREVTALKPGARVLVIMGSSHKPWIDHYLGMMMDLEVVDATAVLR